MAQWIDTPEVAKMIRKALRQHWPHVKFSVRSERYAGGSSIDIRWTDGPAGSEVDPIAKQYEGSRFDGMIDMATSAGHWLLPDGSVQVAEVRGTEGSKGTIPDYVTDSPHPDAIEVRFSSDYVFCRREVSDREAKKTKALDMINAQCHVENGRFGNQWVDVLADGVVHDQRETEDMQITFERVVLRR